MNDSDTYLVRTKEHCLVGIKGQIRRSNDTHLIHTNIDCDVIVSEEPEMFGSTKKPKEIYDIIEHFSLGRRRLELFGTDECMRDGWLTIGNRVTKNTFVPR